MSTIDASIPLGVQPYKAPDQMNMLAQLMQVQGAQNQNALAQYTLGKAKRDDEDQTAIRSELAAGADPYKVLLGRGKVTEATAYQKGQREADKAQTELVDARLKQSREMLTGVQTPEQFIQWHQANHADPVLGPVLAARGITPEQSMARIQQALQTPGGFQKLLQESALGVTEFIKQNAPKIHMQDTGGASNVLSVPGLGGAPTVLSTTTKTATPGELMADQRTRSEGAANRAQAERHFQAGQNAPQYMETDAGLVALPKKLTPGQQPTGTPVLGAGGQPLGKPLKDIPPAVNSAIIQNNQSLNQIDRALTLLEGTDVGTQKGDKSATGVKGYLPQGILNRLDPGGVDARAEVADIGSLKIHDRSGAAVTVSESPRLVPFVPLATDDAATVKKKLTRLKTEIQNERDALSVTYSRDQGYKPSPVQPQGRPVDLHQLPSGKPKVVNFGDLK